jgi:hypothetical protein
MSLFSALSGFINGSGSGACNIGITHNAYWPMSGYLDDVRVYNRALSPAEIQAIYNAKN